MNLVYNLVELLKQSVTLLFEVLELLQLDLVLPLLAFVVAFHLSDLSLFFLELVLDDDVLFFDFL